MSKVGTGYSDSISMESNQSPARHFYGTSPVRRHHDSSCSDVSYSERPLLHSTPCRRLHYDACLQSEARWNTPRNSEDSCGQAATTTRHRGDRASSWNNNNDNCVQLERRRGSVVRLQPLYVQQLQGAATADHLEQ